MTARPDHPRAPGVYLRLASALLLGSLSACGGATSGEAPGPRRPDVPGADADEERPAAFPAAAPELEGQLGDAPADDGMEAGPAERLAAGEAALARYEARLAAAGVRVRGRGRPSAAPLGGALAEPPAPPSAGDAPRKKASNKSSTGTGAGYGGEGSGSVGASRRRPVRSENTPTKKDAAPPRGAARDDEDEARRVELAEELEAEREASRIDPRPRCEEICGLVEAICALEAQLCSLADAHRWDQRYVDACARATEDCEAAESACIACSP